MTERKDVRTRGERIVHQLVEELKTYFTEDETIEIYDGSSLKYEVKEIKNATFFHLRIEDPTLKVRHRHVTIEVRESF